jgi:opacity protein-like surface antigen
MQRDHDQQVGVPTWVWAFACAILIALGVVATTNAARAADKGGPSANFLEVKDVEKAPWTGPWASVNLSYTMQSTEVGPFAFDANSVSYGVGVGYDIQLGRVVVGVMADHDWTKADSAISEFSRSWFAGARLGWLITDNALMYGLAGYTSLDGTVPAGFDSYKGLTLGGGLEILRPFALPKNWSLKAEFRHVDLGSDPVFGPFTAEHSQNQGRLGLAYRF